MWELKILQVVGREGAKARQHAPYMIKRISAHQFKSHSSFVVVHMYLQFRQPESFFTVLPLDTNVNEGVFLCSDCIEVPSPGRVAVVDAKVGASFDNDFQSVLQSGPRMGFGEACSGKRRNSEYHVLVKVIFPTFLNCSSCTYILVVHSVLYLCSRCIRKKSKERLGDLDQAVRGMGHRNH